MLSSTGRAIRVRLRYFSWSRRTTRTSSSYPLMAAASVYRGRFETLAEQRLTEALGASVEITQLHWARGAVRAREVKIEGSDRGVGLRLESVSVFPSLHDLIMERRISIARVEVAGVEARIDERILSRFAGEEGTGAAGPIGQSFPGLQTHFSKRGVVDFPEMKVIFSSQGRERLTLRGTMTAENVPAGFRLRGSAGTADEGRVLWSGEPRG